MPDSGRRIEGFEEVHWTRWGEALGVGPSAPGADGLVLITDGDERLLRLLHSRKGPLPPQGVRFPGSLAQIASDHGCSWLLQLSMEDAKALAAESWARRSDQDYLARLLSLWGALQDLQSEGRLESFPHRLDRWPALVDLAPRGLASLCPDDHVAVAAIWRGTRLSTALAFRRRRGRIDRIVGPAVLQEAMGLVSGDWTRDYRYLSQAVERHLGSLGLGFFAQEAAARELSRRGDAAAWARAVATRDVIVSPMSAGMALSLGVDLGRTVLRRARDFVSGRGFGGWIPPELGPLFESEAHRPDLRDLLGVDAFSLLEQATAAQGDPLGGDSFAPLAGAGG